MDSSLSSRSSSGTGCGDGCLFGGVTPLHQSSATFVQNARATTAVVAPSELTDDVLLARELNELSFEEREKVYGDIHGVTDSVEETPEFLEKCLQEFDLALSKVPRTKRPSYDRAIFLKPSIATDTKFKLIFLRAVDYDAVEAARRMAKYFDDKAKLFGEDKIVKAITLDDFSEEDMELFRRGPYITAPGKDSVGRRIWMSNVPKFDFVNLKSQLRIAWYVIMTSLLEDEDNQIRGMCNILYCPSGIKFGIPIHKILHYMMSAGEVVETLPVKFAAHFLYDNAAMEFVLSAIRRAFGREHRLRLRAHYGSGIEIQYKLMTYGINLDFLLEDNTDRGGTDDKMKVHHQYLQERVRLEEERSQQEENFYQETIASKNRAKDKRLFIPHPNANDVLVGRGSPYQTWSGNVKLSELIESQFLIRYSQATDKFEKTLIHIDVVKAIQENRKGRFIERTPQGWQIVDDNVARKKVNSSFRSNMAKLNNQAKSLSSNTSSVHSMASSTVEVGMKTKQPWGNNSYNAGDNQNGFFQMAFGGFGGSAKRARYDPSLLIPSNGNRPYSGTSWQ